MPAASEYKPNDRVLIEAGGAELKQRRTMIQRHRAYYEGRHDTQLKKGKDGTDWNVVLNLTRQAIDRTASFLLPEMPTLEIDPLSEPTEEQAATTDADTPSEEDYVRDFWDVNGGVTRLQNIFLNGALSGQPYVRLVPREDGFPKLVNLNPEHIITWWDAEDHERTLWYELRWRVELPGAQNKHDQEPNFRQEIIAIGEDGEVLRAGERMKPVRWVIREWRRSSGTRWVQFGDDIAWDFAMAPIQTGQHLPKMNSYYGEHELAHLALNDKVNFIASDINKILYTHAHPVGLMFGAELGKAVDVGIGKIIDGLPGENARYEQIELESDLAASNHFQALLMDMFYSQSRVVMLQGGLDAFKNVTNLGIRALFMDMIAKNHTLRRQYGELMTNITLLALELDGRSIDVRPKLEWGEALPVDRREEFALVNDLRLNGYISMAMARERLGIDHLRAEREISLERAEEDIALAGFPVGVSN